MALFPERIVFKNSTTGTSTLIAEVAPGSISPLVPGELLMYRESDGFRLYSLSISGSVVQVGARIKNENKGSLTVTNFGEGSSSFVLNDGSVAAVNIPDASIPNVKFASPLSIEKGGTGQTTAATAINALLPSQVGNADKVLATDGTTLSWDSKKIILNEYENIDTVTDPPVNGDCLAWNSATSNWVPDQDIPASTVPASATDTGRPGQLAFDSNYLYSCVGVNRWKRAPLSTWNYAQILPLIINSTASINSPSRVGAPVPELVGIGTPISSRTPSIPWHAGHIAGDIGILVTIGGVGAAIAGWTLINSSGSPRVYYKYATSNAEPNVTTNTNNNDFDGQIIVFRNIAGSNPVDAWATAGYANPSTNIQPLSVTTTTNNCAVLYFQTMGGTCATTGGCQTATAGTLEPALYYDYEEFNGGSIAGMLQAHAGRKLTAGVASTGLTYISGAYATFSPNNQVTVALKQRPGPANIILPPVKDTVVVGEIPKAGNVEPFFSSVSLLLPMNGANGSTTFTDISNSNYTLNVSGGAVISTAQSKFGGTSMHLPGNGRVYRTGIDNNLCNWRSTNFTIEYWARLTAYTWSTAFLTHPVAVGGMSPSNAAPAWGFGPIGGGVLKWDYYRSDINTWSGFTTSGSVVALNTWHHLAAVYDQPANTVRMYVDGIMVASSGIVGTAANWYEFSIGQCGSAYFNGYIDDLRITFGVARYSANFTPPTSSFPVK